MIELPNVQHLSRRAAMLTMASAALVPAYGVPGRNARAAMPARTDFAVFRNGSEVGYHRFDVQQSGNRTEISIEILLEVGLGPVVLYRYTHRNREIYESGRFLSFASETNDDGERYSVGAERVENRIRVTRSLDEDYETDDLTLLPTTWWNPATKRANNLLDTQKGRIFEVAISPQQWEPVETPQGAVDAHRFQIDGDLTLTVWYDRDDRLVRIYFPWKGDDFDYALA